MDVQYMMQLDIQHEPGLTRRVQLLVNNLHLAGFLMRFTCRGFAGRHDKAKDISDYSTKGGSNVLSDNSTTDRIPGRFQSVGSDVIKGARVCKQRVLHTILVRPARSQLNLSLYFPG